MLGLFDYKSGFKLISTSCMVIIYLYSSQLLVNVHEGRDYIILLGDGAIV